MYIYVCVWGIPCQIIQAIAPPISDSLKIWTEGTAYQSMISVKIVFAIFTLLFTLQPFGNFEDQDLSIFAYYNIWILSQP